LAYKVLSLPHLSMRLVVGQIYTLAELEGRCGRHNEARRKKLHGRLADRTYFEPASLASAFRQEPAPKRAKTEEVLPAWARLPVVCPAPGSKEELTRRRMIANGIAEGLLARAASGGKRIADQDVRDALRAWGFCRNGQRRNVLPPGQEWVHSDTLGLVKTRDQRIHVSSASRRHPSFTLLLNRWLRDQWPEGVPADFPFTSISVNKNYAAKRHRDGSNAGPSLLKALGSFRGGQLRYWPRDNRRVKDVKALRMKDSVVVDVRKVPIAFNGNCAHEVLPFKGERFSLVFFTSGKYLGACEAQREALRKLGFAWPTEESLLRSSGALSRPRATDEPGGGSEPGGEAELAEEEESELGEEEGESELAEEASELAGEQQ